MAACLAAAGSGLRLRSEELATLRELDRAIEQLSAELSLRLTSLPELAELLAQSTRGKAGDFFCLLAESLDLIGERSFSVLWDETLQHALPELDERAKEAMRRLGLALGRYELDAQLASAAECRTRLRALAEEKAGALAGSRRVSLGLSAACGGILCIMLL